MAKWEMSHDVRVSCFSFKLSFTYNCFIYVTSAVIAKLAQRLSYPFSARKRVKPGITKRIKKNEPRQGNETTKIV